MTTDTTVVETTCGPVRGSDDGRVKAWKGVRYAAAPVGDLRWRAPEPPKPWTEVVDAVAFGPVCPQPIEPTIPVDLGAPQGEDCLTLNIWASSATEPGDAKPVMVWVHGGAYIFGAASQPLYDGSVLAGSADVLVVTVNYRLGALGFLDLSSFNTPKRRFDSNLGLRDVLHALHWVRDNIAAFGGDPQRVTLFGESAGGGVITTLLTVPAAEALFSGAIAQSSPATSVYDGSRGRRVAGMMLARLGIDGAEVNRLSQTPTASLIAASKQVFDAVPVQTPGTLAFAPIVDGDLVPDYPVKLAREGRSHPVPLIIGTNKHEAALFRWMKSPLMPITPPAIKAMFAEIAAEQPSLQLPSEAQIGSVYGGIRVKARGMGVARDVGFRMPSVWLAEGHSTVAPVYLYRFDWATPMLKLMRIGATHATELPYVWGNLVQGPKDVTFRLGGLKTGKAVSARMQARWLNFATQAKPTGLNGEPEWVSYHAADRACLIIDRQDAVVNDIDVHIRAAWGGEVLNFR
ncbi:carboxylesterase/lipase family protein [Mycobacterium sp.]|uniref:carboxylesterase/lipase family protein n=1 Tax=Mycobacterium sp. TaxID=1785 RepID=UPI002B89053D|nr:carboxylesterase/lipase family protein [Mycobacterium sp.]HME49822.1 carboxylesterase/lipase family protein [Mycobacterium sp.]